MMIDKYEVNIILACSPQVAHLGFAILCLLRHYILADHLFEIFSSCKSFLFRGAAAAICSKTIIFKPDLRFKYTIYLYVCTQIVVM
jgi:hypothetical protein